MDNRGEKRVQERLALYRSRLEKGGCYLSRGDARVAVYDLEDGKIISLEKGFFQELGVALPPVEQVVERRVEPSGVWLDLTEHCNLRCIHCYAEAGRPLSRELGVGEWRRVVDDLVSSGHGWFTLAGGEPLMVRDLPLLLDHLFEKAETVVVITNATLLAEREDVLERMEGHREKGSFLISFYSHRPDIHDRITSVKGSWRRTLQGIKEVLKREIPYNINVPLCSVNEKGAEETLTFLASLGVDRNRMGLNLVYPMGRGSLQGILPSEITKFSVKRVEYGLPLSSTGRLVYKSCWAGKLLVMADGRVTPCPSVREEDFVVGSVREQPIAEILQSEKLARLWSFTLDEVEECKGCEFRYGCHHCPAMALAWRGDIKAKNPYCLYSPERGEWRTLPSKKEAVLGKRYYVEPSFEAKKVGGDLYLFSEDGELHLLNPTAQEIYELLREGWGPEEIVSRLAEKYDAPLERLEGDVLSLLKEMEEKGIILPESSS